MKAIIYIIGISILFSCKNNLQEKNNPTFETPKLENVDKDTLLNKIYKKESELNYEIKETDILYNTELVGLCVKDLKKTNPHGKYWIDFNSACMCDSPSFYIDTKKNKIYFFSYCKNELPPNKIEVYYEYNIEKIISIKGKVSVFLNEGKILNVISQKSDFNDELIPSVYVLNFFKIENTPIYKLEIEGNLPTAYIGARVNGYFTPTPSKFEIEDCGDFDG